MDEMPNAQLVSVIGRIFGLNGFWRFLTPENNEKTVIWQPFFLTILT